jgi:hypothetical protein
MAYRSKLGYPQSKVKWVPPYDAKERHLPGYNFCGPGTNVHRRLRNGVKPMNKLDAAALRHDLAVEPRGPYVAKGHGPSLRLADRILMEEAQRLLFVKGEQRWACLAVISAMQGLLATGARGRGLKD